MQPVTPVFPGRADLDEVVYAEDQPEYFDLPAIRFEGREGRVTTRWRLTWRERWHMLWRGDLYLTVLTFGGPLQPVLLETTLPEMPAIGQSVDGSVLPAAKQA